MKSYNKVIPLLLLAVLLTGNSYLSMGQQVTTHANLDDQVRAFLASQNGKWHDLNVPAVDGQLLYDIIVKNHYKNALEIGTSTGHSGIWIAWALSKTGGKLTTIEIDPGRHRKALENFQKAGLSDYIDARLADAHTLVKELQGPFDFVFSDADKGWYTQYFKDVDPKLSVGGCFTAHNVSASGYGYYGTGAFLRYVKSLSNYKTTVNTRGAGVSVSYKISER